MIENHDQSSDKNGGDQNGQCQDIKRDGKGRFLKGFAGPGRGKKKKQEPLTFEQIELALQKDLTSSDAKVRHPAVKLLLALKKQLGQPFNSATIDPAIKKALQGYTDDLFSVEEMQETGEDDITN